jgi:hypothetical protein
MSDAPQKRRFWQIHLSTALIMMLLASGIVYLNVRSVVDHQSMSEVGWPYTAVAWGPFIDQFINVGAPGMEYCSKIHGIFINWKRIAASLALIGIPYLAVGVLIEYVVRRKGKLP